MLSTNALPSEGLIVLPCSGEPLVSILIPTTSQADLLTRCLQSLARHLSADIAVEIIIVLNAATDAVKAVVRQTRGALAAESSANLGVAGGYNRGRSIARGRYLMLLHDDTEIEPRWLESLVETAEAHPEAGAVASMVLFPGGQLQGAGWIIWREVATSSAWGTAPAPNPAQYTEIRPVDYSGTSSLLVRSGTWDIIGGLDERLYPAYCVDMDLCMSIRKHGQIVLFDPRSRLFHHRGSSSKPAFRQFMAERNQVIFSAKWKDEMQSYEPYAPHDVAAIKRAQAVTEQIALQLTEKWNSSPPTPPAPAPHDAASQEQAHLLKEQTLRREYTSWLESRCVELEARLKSLSGVFDAQCRQAASALLDSQNARERTRQKLALKKAESVKLKSKCTALKAELETIKSSRWWRWGRRLRKMFGRHLSS